MRWNRSRSHDLIAILLLIAAGSLFFADILIGARSLFIRDLTRYYYPTKQIIREVILSGDFPSWNPYYSAGQPMAANPEYEVFYPPQWLILLPNYDLGYRLHIVFHIYAGLIGMYLLLRSMALRIPSSFFGAISFGLGGVFLSMVNLLPILFCVTWMPLAFLFARRFFLGPNLRDFAIATLFLGLQTLTAEPVTLIQTWFMLGCYALYRGWYAESRRIMTAARNVGFVALFVIAAVAIGAVQFIPAMDHAGDSVRARPFEFWLVTSWSMTPARPLELIFPNIFGHLMKDLVSWYWGGGLYPRMGSPFLFGIYSGILVIALAIAGAFVRPRGGRFVIVLAAVSTLLALGGHTPFFAGLYEIGITAIRYPEKFALIGLFAVIVFAAQMFDRCISGDRKLIDLTMGFLLAVSALSLAVWLFSFTYLYDEWFANLWGLTKDGNRKLMLEMSKVDWLVGAIRGSVAFTLFWLIRNRPPRAAWYATTFSLVLVDLFLVTYELLPRMPRHFFTPPPLASEIEGEPSSYRIFHEVDWYGDSEVSRRYFGTGRAVYWVVRNGLFPMTPASWGFRTVLERDYDKTALLPTVDLVDSMWAVRDAGQPEWREIFAAMSNARYVSQYRDFDKESTRVSGDMRRSHPIEFRAMPFAPRYYFAEQIVQIRDRNDFIQKLVKESWSRKAAFVDFPAFEPLPARVLSVRERSNEATIEVEAKGRSLLVMSVTPHKYWEVRIGDFPAKLEVVNIGYQGVVVPAGKHRVTIRYRNRLIPITGGVTLVSILLFSGIAVFARRRVPAPLVPSVSAEEPPRAPPA